MISLDERNGSCNSFDHFSAKICIPNKTKKVNFKVFNILTKKNEAKTLIKHIPCDGECKFNNTACNSNQK